MRKWTQIKLYTGKHEKPTDENIMRLLMPSILGVLVCMVCLFGSTWAWFTAGIQVDGDADAATAAANFSADVTVREIPGATVQTIAAIQAGETGRALTVQSDENTENASGESEDKALDANTWNIVTAEDNDGMDFELQEDTAYAVEIRAAGSTTIGGYVVISDGNREYYTVDMQSAEARDGNGDRVKIAGAEDMIEFFVIPGKTAVYHFTPVWGEYEGSREDGTALLSDLTDAGAYVDVDTLKDKEGDSVAAAASDAGIVWFSNRIRIGDGSVIGNGSLPVADGAAITGDEPTADDANGTDSTDSTAAENGTVSGEDHAQSGSDATGAGSDSDSGKNGAGSDKTGSNHDGAALSSGSDGNGSSGSGGAGTSGGAGSSTAGSGSASAGTDEGHGSSSSEAESGGNHGNTSSETGGSGTDAGTGAE